MLERCTSIKVALFTNKNGDEISGKSCSGCHVRRLLLLVILALLRPQPNVETRKEGVEIFRRARAQVHGFAVHLAKRLEHADPEVDLRLLN